MVHAVVVAIRRKRSKLFLLVVFDTPKLELVPTFVFQVKGRLTKSNYLVEIVEDNSR